MSKMSFLGGFLTPPVKSEESADMSNKDHPSSATISKPPTEKSTSFYNAFSGVKSMVSSYSTSRTSVEPPLNKRKSSSFKAMESLLQRFRLQSPPNHLGMIIAFNEKLLTPYPAEDFCFSWHRVRGQHFEDIRSYNDISLNSHSWYPPTADDLGSVILLHCEDTAGFGLSRQLTSAPIYADDSFTNRVENVIEQNKLLERVVISSSNVSYRSSARDKNLTEENSNSDDSDGSGNIFPLRDFEVGGSIAVNSEGILLREKGTKDCGLHIDSTNFLSLTCVHPCSFLVELPLYYASKCNDNQCSDPLAPISSIHDLMSVSALRPSLEWLGEPEGELFSNLEEIIDPEENPLDKSLEDLVGMHEENFDALFSSICLQISCRDRMTRDLLVLSIRCLAGHVPALDSPSSDTEVVPFSESLPHRLDLLPWRSGSYGFASNGGVDTPSGVSAQNEACHEENVMNVCEYDQEPVFHPLPEQTPPQNHDEHEPHHHSFKPTSHEISGETNDLIASLQQVNKSLLDENSWNNERLEEQDKIIIQLKAILSENGINWNKVDHINQNNSANKLSWADDTSDCDESAHNVTLNVEHRNGIEHDDGHACRAEVNSECACKLNGRDVNNALGIRSFVDKFSCCDKCWALLLQQQHICEGVDEKYLKVLKLLQDNSAEQVPQNDKNACVELEDALLSLINKEKYDLKISTRELSEGCESQDDAGGSWAQAASEVERLATDLCINVNRDFDCNAKETFLSLLGDLKRNSMELSTRIEENMQMADASSGETSFSDASRELQSKVKALSEQLAEKEESYQKKCTEFAEKQDGLTESVSVLQAKCDKVEEARRLAEQAAEELRREMAALQDQREALEAKVEELEQRKESDAAGKAKREGEERARLKKEISHLKEMAVSQEKERGFKEAALARIRSDYDSLSSRHQELKTQYDMLSAQCERDKREAKAEFDKLSYELSQSQNTVKVMEARITGLQSETLSLTDERQSLKRQKSAFDSSRSQIAQLRGQLVESDQSAQATRALLEETSSLNERLKKEKSDIAIELEKSNKLLAKKTARIEELKDRMQVMENEIASSDKVKNSFRKENARLKEATKKMKEDSDTAKRLRPLYNQQLSMIADGQSRIVDLESALCDMTTARNEFVSLSSALEIKTGSLQKTLRATELLCERQGMCGEDSYGTCVVLADTLEAVNKRVSQLEAELSEAKSAEPFELKKLNFMVSKLKGEKNHYESKAKSLSKDLQRKLLAGTPLQRELGKMTARLEEVENERNAYRDAMVLACETYSQKEVSYWFG